MLWKEAQAQALAACCYSPPLQQKQNQKIKMVAKPCLAAFTLRVCFFVSLSLRIHSERERERERGSKMETLIGWSKQVMQALRFLGLGMAGERPFSTFSFFLFLVILTVLSLLCTTLPLLFSLSLSLEAVFVLGF
ncbi:hypothetical protein D0Y65_009189 [Glycine soja]|uniref:Uncharacterized protein n=1 Tax=Glycine soja TaxID=3848 RepID=A0A445KXR2_GLYSO|nr:hypothetical protein D0Y65_009189 [Glycine soja]